jgi:hypothetical protein
VRRGERESGNSRHVPSQMSLGISGGEGWPDHSDGCSSGRCPVICMRPTRRQVLDLTRTGEEKSKTILHGTIFCFFVIANDRELLQGLCALTARQGRSRDPSVRLGRMPMPRCRRAEGEM